MTLETQLEELRKQHEDLSREVERKQQNPASDTLAITELKKRKLQLKEQINHLSKG